VPWARISDQEGRRESGGKREIMMMSSGSRKRAKMRMRRRKVKMKKKKAVAPAVPLRCSQKETTEETIQVTFVAE
jgi:hypothetical protein